MKNKIIFTIAVVLLMLGSIFYAYGEKNNTKIEFNENVTIEEKTEKLKKWMTPAEFITLLEEQGCYPDEINKYMEKLIKVSALYDFTERDFKEIYKLTKKGYNLGEITDIYLFVMDTKHPKDYKYIEKFCEEAQLLDTDSEYKLEEVYNRMEKEKHGVLSEDEISEYFEKGITSEEIFYADLLSRKSDTKVKELLNEKVKGVSWDEIVSKALKDKEISSLNSENASLSRIMECVYFSEITNSPVSEVVSNEKNKRITDKAVKNLNKKIELSEKLDVGFEDFKFSEEKILSFAKEKIPDVPEKTIKACIKKGYMIKELEEINKEAKRVNISFEECME